MDIVFKDLPKVSLNAWYSGGHWSGRSNMKKEYKVLVKNQFKHTFPKTNKYHCEYLFGFKNNPLDASNCVAMVKLIEDVIFEDDKFDIVKSIKINSVKASENFVILSVL